MNTLKRLAQQSMLALVIAAVTVAFGLPTLFAGVASAVGGQVTSRSITLSNSAPSATGVTYTARFTTATTGNIEGVVIDFCANDPLPGDTCTTTGTLTSFTIGASPSVANTGLNAGTWLTTNSTAHTLIYSNASATTPVSSGTAITVTLSNVTNPTPGSYPGSFYARFLTYAVSTTATAYTSTAPGAYIDYGGDAISTVQNINITAKVFETLSFCVFNSSCGTQATLILGDPTTGALSTSAAYGTPDTGTNSAQYTLATNAGSGVSVTMTGTTLCRSTGSNCNTATTSPYTITSIGATPHVLTTGSEQFGMCTDVTGNTASMVVDTPYLDTANACHGITETSNVYSGTSLFGFDDNTSTGTNSAGGSQVMHAPGAVPNYTGSFCFLADIAATTEAGVYTNSLNMVATSTF